MYKHSLPLAEMAASAGLSLAGIVEAAPLNHLRDRLRQRIAEGRFTSFEERDPELRLAPDRLLERCRSIIVVGLPYLSPDHDLAQFGTAVGPRGKVARCSRGIDYHLLLEERANRLTRLIKRELAGTVYHRILADRSPLVERELARLAGLGWIGRNCALVTPAFGSHVALGTILLDRALEPAVPAADGCLNCNRCLEACPTGALTAPYILDPRRCLSYLTQTSGVVPLGVRHMFGQRLYGCDSCQDACPHNRQAGSLPETAFSFFPAEPLLLPMLRMTQSEFSRTIGLTAAGWRGKTTLQRNTEIALGNSGDDAAVPDLASILKNDARPLLRLHAAWSLGRIGGGKARRFLEASYRLEKDPEVRDEVCLALERWKVRG